MPDLESKSIVLLFALSFLYGPPPATAQALQQPLANPLPILIRSDYNKGAITLACQSSLKTLEESLATLAGQMPAQTPSDQALLSFEKALADFADEVNPLIFMKDVSLNEALRKEAAECEEKSNQYTVSVFSRKDIYAKIADAVTKDTNKSRLQTETLRKFEENGLKFSDTVRGEILKLKQALTALESQFSSNLNEDISTIEFSRIELDGLPEDFLKSLQKSKTGKFIVTTKAPHYVRLMENASVAETRRKMLEAYEDRASENIKLLEEGIQVRQKIASLMGFNTWADYQTLPRMAHNSEAVLKFLTNLKEKLAAKNRSDLASLLLLKKTQDPTASELKSWDISYLANQLKKRDYQLDDEVLKQYFPAERVVAGLFQVYAKILGVQFIELKAAKVWAQGVKAYQIQNQSDKRVIGYFYMDLFPRAGKFSHAAAFTLKSGRLLSSDTYNTPVSAIVANFSSAEGAKPALWKHDEVKTLFHEFGHIMHQTLTQAPYASLSGSSVDRDFVEAPSQMLENWVYAPEILTMISGHYQDFTKKLPEASLKKLIEARDFNQGYFYTRQLMLSLFDLLCHTQKGPQNTNELYKKIYKDVMGLEPAAATNFPAGFGHLMGGYDAGYYGYLWSKVYATDMFTRFEKEGLLNAATGADYRKSILEAGKMSDSMALVKLFLGRESNSEAFYKSLKIDLAP